MKRTLRPLLAVLVVSCSGERAPANDTAQVEGLPPDGSTPNAPVSAWNRAVGSMFAVRSANGANAWLVNPDYGKEQALDTLTASSWNVEGLTLTLIDGAVVVGTARITGMKYDSTCAGWPTASLVDGSSTQAPWRLAFPQGTVDGTPFDSLPTLLATDSATRARDGALAASRLPGDTATAFRGRPFNVRQASRFTIGTDTVVTMYEVVRLVAQEANPLQEQVLIITEGIAGSEPRVVFHRREIGVEESMGSIELLGVLRVRSSGRMALLIRRELESGFVLEWIERSPRGSWTLRWQSAIDSC